MKEFNNVHNLNAEMLFKGITIRNIACNVHENITQISDKLNNTLMNLVLEYNKEKIIETKEAYNKKNEEKRNSIAFGGAGYNLPMEAYEEDMIKNEKSYIEDTIRLMELFCGQVKQDVNKKLVNTEHSEIVELNNHVKEDNIKKAIISLPKGKDKRYELIDISSIGSEPPIHKNKKNDKERTIDGLLASISFLAKARSRRITKKKREVMMNVFL